jgi:hypothetical protein
LRPPFPLRLSRFKLAGLPTPRDTEASNAYAIIHDALGPVCICSLIGINSDVPRARIMTFYNGNVQKSGLIGHMTSNGTSAETRDPLFAFLPVVTPEQDLYTNLWYSSRNML